jgi:YHS domain-containing protein
MIKLTRILALTAFLAGFAISPAHAARQHICPVSGDVLDADSTVPLNDGGKTILLCCKSCVKKYKANPQKYAASVQKALGGS